jgi:aspartate/tyrosine/aromatic aminotransferase
MRGSFFNHIPSAPVDSIFGLTTLFQSETRRDKVDLSVGVYRDDTLHTPILQSVKKAEALLLKSENTKEYLPIDGEPSFIAALGKLIFGELFWSQESRRICGIQALGGTGALSLGANLLKRHLTDKVVISNPAWPNYKNVFTQVGMSLKSYPYYDFIRHGVDFDGCVAFLQNLDPSTCVVLQTCCHNPTGINFSLDEWKIIQEVCKKKELVPFFDFAYQGFGKSIEADACAIRLFVESGMEVFVAYSCSKNFGLYSERVGALFLSTNSEKNTDALKSHLKSIARAIYSNPPRHGESVVTKILLSPDLKVEWQREVDQMRERLLCLRYLFVDMIAKKKCRRDFQFLLKAEGMFCFTELQEKEVLSLQKEFAIYMTFDGRLNVAGLCDHNLQYVVNAMASL